MKTALVCGAGGFIGAHLTRRLKREGFWVRGVDLKRPQFSEIDSDEHVLADLRDARACRDVFDRPFDEVYQLAADMGGAGYLFVGTNDAEVMHNSVQINLNVLQCCRASDVGRVFYSSSACVYPVHLQRESDNAGLSEDSVYPAEPDSEYGWEKLFSERLYLNYMKNHGLQVRIARYHNIFGPQGSWNDGREKSPAALCRKIAEAADGGEIEVWGDGSQTRSYLYIDEGLEATVRLMRSKWAGPVNIGSEEMVSIDRLAAMIAEVAGKKISLRHVPGPVGVQGRRSDNTLIREKLGWAPGAALVDGLRATYPWIADQVARSTQG